MELAAKEKLFAAAAGGKMKDWDECLALSEGMNPSQIVRAQNSHGETPLNVAVAKNQREMIVLFLNHGADVNARGQTTSSCTCLNPLEQALKNRNEEMALLFLNRGAKVNDSRAKTSALHYAIVNNMAQLVRRLIDLGADVNCYDCTHETPLSLALQSKNHQTAEYLIENGANVDAVDFYGSSLIMRFFNDSWAFNALLEKGGNPNLCRPPNERLPLHVACLHGMVQNVGLLLQHGADTEAKSYEMTPLFVASRRGKLEIVKLLLAHGADVNSKSNFGEKANGLKNHNYRALHYAVKNRHGDVVEALLDAGADTNVRQWGGETPIFEAAKHGELQMMKLLADRGANLHVIDVLELSLCHHACLHGHHEVVNYLVEVGVDWCSTDWEGNTCLHVAAEAGHLELVELLLRLGIDAMTKNDKGVLPIMKASPHVDVVHYLVRHMAFTGLLK